MNYQIWIVDFGSQYTQLITRKVRELGHSSFIYTVEEALEKMKSYKPDCLILSGGPQSVFEDQTNYEAFFSHENLPTLGLCYGMQLMGQYFGGEVEKGKQGEYGKAQIYSKMTLNNFPDGSTVWMSHSDHLKKLPNDFELLLESDNKLIAGIKHKERPIVGFQFHPEVSHSEKGKDILDWFLKDIAKLEKDWTADCLVHELSNLVKEAQGKKVLCAFSGGVDSLVAATLAHKVLGNDLYCFFVDHGLLRPQDYLHIQELKEKSGLNIETIEASKLFLDKLTGVSDPEKKRKLIGNMFIDVFEQKVHEFEKDHNIHFEYLLQGTLYPDVIESISPHSKDGKSVTIKSHHNVGGLPEKMKLKLLEPLRYLFKDEVRELGKALELNDSWLYRHPFPGPGIGIRVLGELSLESIQKVQKSDQILFEELKEQQQYQNVWQAFTVLLPVKTVGVKGDGRAYEEVICIRMVSSEDGMTATFSELPYEFLAKASRRITNEVPGVTRVVYDITSKPPGTIEWE